MINLTNPLQHNYSQTAEKLRLPFYMRQNVSNKINYSTRILLWGLILFLINPTSKVH